MTRKEAIQILNMVEAHGNLAIQAKALAIDALQVLEDLYRRDDVNSYESIVDKARKYEELKRMLFGSAKVLRQQAQTDENFFGPDDKFTCITRTAANILEDLIDCAELDDEYRASK